MYLFIKLLGCLPGRPLAGNSLTSAQSHQNMWSHARSCQLFPYWDNQHASKCIILEGDVMEDRSPAFESVSLLSSYCTHQLQEESFRYQSYLGPLQYGENGGRDIIYVLYKAMENTQTTKHVTERCSPSIPHNRATKNWPLSLSLSQGTTSYGELWLVHLWAAQTWMH